MRANSRWQGWHRHFLVAASLLYSGCFPAQQPGPSAGGARAVAVPELGGTLAWGPLVVPEPLPLPASPTLPLLAPKVTRAEIDGISFEGVAFDSRTQRLIVADQPDGPGSRWADAAEATAARDGLAGINAGFFTPEGKPLGKVVAAGTSAGAWNRGSSLGSAVWWESTAGVAAIARREAVATDAPARELLQAGPVLVERGKAVEGLEATKASIRSVLVWDGGSRWWLGRATACTLADLGRSLATGEPGGWPVRSAINLDGGRSADLAVTAGVAGGPLVRRAPWNRPVRNFLVLVPR